MLCIALVFRKASLAAVIFVPFAVAGCLIFPPQARAQDARALVQHYIDTVSGGDVRNWDEVRTAYKEGTSWYSQHNFDQKVSFTAQDKPSFLRHYHRYPYDARLEGYADSSYTLSQSVSYFLEKKTILLIGNVPPIIKQARDRDRFFSPHFPVTLSKMLKASSDVRLLEYKSFPGDSATFYEVAMPVAGKEHLLYLDTRTGLLGYYDGRADEGVGTIERLERYIAISGFLIPAESSLLRNGVVYFRFVITRCELNLPLDDALFVYEQK